MTDMVQMVVGDQDSLERIKSQPVLCQCLLQASEADTGIYKDAGFSFRYLVRSAKNPQLVLFDATFKKEEYQ